MSQQVVVDVEIFNVGDVSHGKGAEIELSDKEAAWALAKGYVKAAQAATSDQAQASDSQESRTSAAKVKR